MSQAANGHTTSRRSFLKMAPAGLATAYAASLAVSGSAEGDEALFAMRPILAEAYRRWGVSCQVSGALEARAFNECGVEHPGLVENWSGSFQEWNRRFEDWKVAKDAALERVNYADALAVTIEDGETFHSLVGDFLKIRASSLEGMRFKVEAATDFIDEEIILHSLIDDLEAITGPLAPWSFDNIDI